MSGERPGFRGIPYAMEAELRALPPAQRAILLSLAFLAEWEARSYDVRGVLVALDVGEALISYEGLARDLRANVDLARRAIRSGVRIGLIHARRAIPAPVTPRATGDATYRATPHGTPPTVVRFLRHREILWARENGATPCATPCASGDATNPQITGSQDTGRIPSPAARARARRADHKAPDPRHAPLTERLAATFAEVRGTSYAHGGGRDAKAIADLLRFAGGNVEEVDRRWRRALDLGPKWPGCATFAALALRWNDLAPLAEPHLGVAPASRHVEGFVDVGAVLAKRGRP